MSLLEKKAIKLFVDHTKFKSHQIKLIKHIHKGYTNISFLIILINNQKYQVRLANDNGIVNRKSELAILKNIHNKNFLYYDIKTGNAIKEWIDGVNPTNSEINSKIFLDIFSSELNKLHSCKNLNGVINHDYFEFVKIARNKISNTHLTKYLNLLSKYKNLKLVLSHNDLSQDNLLWNEKEKRIFFIDYEWARMNNQYWDIANFIRESNLKKTYIKYLAHINKLDYQILKDFIYICTNYALQWTFAMPQTTKILTYRKKLLIKLNKYL